MNYWKLLKDSLFMPKNCSKEGKRLLWILFFLYFLVLLKVIVFKYPLGELKAITQSWEKDVILEGLGSANFTLFKTIRMYIRYWGRLNSFENLFGNILAFVPFGFLLPYLQKSCRHWLVLLIHAFLLVSAIEVFQLITAFGAFDVDDILLNCLGAMIGHLFYRLLQRRLTKKAGFLRA